MLIAFLLTLLAGLSTGLGGLCALLPKMCTPRFMSVSLGFSAGVMVYVSMAEILGHAGDALAAHFGEGTGGLLTSAGFFGGMLFIAVIDRLVPMGQNPHEPREEDCGKGVSERQILSRSAAPVRPQSSSLLRTGLMTALVVGLHNVPEGLATFVAALQEPELALPIVAAIALHNIPEGAIVAMPIYAATGSRVKGVLAALGSGLTEPLGALAGYALLAPLMSGAVYGILYAGAAGIMVFVSLDELLPSARAYGEHHLAIYGMMAGMAVMAVGLWLL